MDRRCSSIMKKQRLYCGRGILGAGPTERCAPCHRSRMLSLLTPLGPGSLPGPHARLNRRWTMATYQLNVNGQSKKVDVDPGTPLLWILREDLKMTGTKYGCGISACGACTVHVDGIATRSCVVPVSLIGNRKITTIEAIAQDPVGRVVQNAWVEKDVVQ